MLCDGNTSAQQGGHQDTEGLRDSTELGSLGDSRRVAALDGLSGCAHTIGVLGRARVIGVPDTPSGGERGGRASTRSRASAAGIASRRRVPRRLEWRPAGDGAASGVVRHTSVACIDASLAKEVLSTRAKGEVNVGVGAGVDAVAAAWGVMERVCETSSRRRGQAERKIGSANKPIISTMLCNLGRGQAGGSKQKEESVGDEA